MERWHHEAQGLSNHDARDENVPLGSVYESYPSLYHDHRYTITYPGSEASLWDTQAITALNFSAVPDLCAPSPFERRYPFGPSTSSMMLGATHLPVWQAPEPSIPSYHLAPPKLSQRATLKHLLDDEEDDIADDAPALKKSRSSEDESVESQIVEGESSASRADLATDAPSADAGDKNSQAEEAEEDVPPEADDCEAGAEEQEAQEEEGQAEEAKAEEPELHAKRSRRTKEEVLKTTRRLLKVVCPVPGCVEVSFNPYDHDGNRAHLAKHIKRTAVIRCPWPACVETDYSRKPEPMVQHITEVHIGLPYVCPLSRKCKWASTKSQWQTQHMQRDCDYRPGGPCYSDLVSTLLLEATTGDNRVSYSRQQTLIRRQSKSSKVSPSLYPVIRTVSDCGRVALHVDVLT